MILNKCWIAISFCRHCNSGNISLNVFSILNLH